MPRHNGHTFRPSRSSRRRQARARDQFSQVDVAPAAALAVRRPQAVNNPGCPAVQTRRRVQVEAAADQAARFDAVLAVFNLERAHGDSTPMQRSANIRVSPLGSGVTVISKRQRGGAAGILAILLDDDCQPEQLQAVLAAFVARRYPAAANAR